jgi:hypothetical protein
MVIVGVKSKYSDGVNFWSSGFGHQNGFDSTYRRAEALLSTISFVAALPAPVLETVNIGDLYI